MAQFIPTYPIVVNYIHNSALYKNATPQEKKEIDTYLISKECVQEFARKFVRFRSKGVIPKKSFSVHIDKLEQTLLNLFPKKLFNQKQPE